MRAKSLFGLVMRTRRESCGFSQKELAYCVGCDETLIDRVERASLKIPGVYLVAWANALRLPPERVVLDYVNHEVRTMCLDAGIAPLFRIVPLEENYAAAPLSALEQAHAGDYPDMASRAEFRYPGR